MAQTSTGGKKMVETINKKYGEEHWKTIGSKGGSRKVKKGFACATPEQRKAWGAKGGRRSVRRKLCV